MKQPHKIYVKVGYDSLNTILETALAFGCKVENVEQLESTASLWMVVDLWEASISYTDEGPKAEDIGTATIYDEKKPFIPFSYLPETALVSWSDKNGNGMRGNLDFFNTTADKETVSQINLFSNEITNLVIGTQLHSLAILSLMNNRVTSLDVSNNKNLSYLHCGSNWLTTLDLSKNEKLNSLQCFNNKLTSLDVSNHISMSILYCHDNELTTLNVKNNPALKLLDCSGNKLTSLDVSNNPNLTTLSAYNMPIPSIDISNNSSLTYVDFGGNPFSVECINAILTNLDKNGKLRGYAALYATNVPTVTEVIASLRSKGWHLELDGGM